MLHNSKNQQVTEAEYFRSRLCYPVFLPIAIPLQINDFPLHRFVRFDSVYFILIFFFLYLLIIKHLRLSSFIEYLHNDDE